MQMAVSRRQFLGAVGAGVVRLALSRVAWQQPLRRPNIVLIFSDDQGYAEIGCQGCADIPTPHLDAICAEGVRCTSGYVTCPLCSPSRAGLLTGRYQQRFGHEHNPGAAPAAGLPLTETTLADRFRAAGYTTGLIGKWHLGMMPEQHPMSRGFDEFFGFLHGAHSYLRPNESRTDPLLRGRERVEESEYLTDAFAREACGFIDRHATDPFFLYLAFNAVHSPLEATPEYLDRFEGIADPNRRTFAGRLSAMDDAVGRVLATLRRHDLERDTLVIFISDNGGPTPQTTSSNAPLRGYKAQVYEGGIRVPFALRWPGRLPAGLVYDRPVSSLDVVPTVLAAVGAQLPAGLDGVNLAPYLSGANAASPHEQLCWRMGQKTAIRRGDWKLVREVRGDWELYNLAEDIGEQKDLAATEPARLAELRDALAAWDAQMIEPLWTRESFGNRGGNLRQRFEQFDEDGDGRLSPDEAPTEQWFRRADTDGDGFVSFDEARAAMRAGQGR
ncbi:MAG: sulfatase-like hydrolase/transferase [Armatimonadota bacterium]